MDAIVYAQQARDSGESAARTPRWQPIRLAVLRRAKRHVQLLAITIAFVLFRLPALLNAGFINSDGAVTGLQARHMLRGEWQWLHWAREYLTSIDSLMAAPFLAVLGPSPEALMLATMTGELMSVWLAHAVLRKRFDAWTAAIGVLPLVFTTTALNIYLFFHIRQWCLALVMASFWLLDGASASRRPLSCYAMGAFFGFAALFVDLYAIQFLPSVLVFGLLCCFDGRLFPRRLLLRTCVFLLGVGVACAFVKHMQDIAHVWMGRANWSLAPVESNLQLLLHTCLPWLLGTKVYAFGSNPVPNFWSPPPSFVELQIAGTVILGSLLVFGYVAHYLPRIPWKVRRLGLLGTALVTSSLAGFSVSTVASDIWCARFLAPIALATPFFLAPAGFVLRRWLGLVLSPYLLTIAVAGWLGFGMFVSGPLPVRTPRGTAREEAEVRAFLRQRGVHHATAHYWLAYRLTYLFREDPIVVPLDSEDRYGPYRTQYDAAKKVAYIFHPSQPWLDPRSYEGSLRETDPNMETISLYDFTIFIVTRK